MILNIDGIHIFCQTMNKSKHKEFFYITPQEAIKILEKEFDCDVHFVNEEESGNEE